MGYDTIQPAAFVPNPKNKGFHTVQHTLAFPKSWREDVLTLIRVGKKNPERIKQIWISRLNAAIAAIAPDLVSVATYATVDDTMPWLYASEPFPPATMDALIGAWLLDLQPTFDAHQAVKDAWRRLETRRLEWDLTGVDLLECTVSEGGTAVPAHHLFRLLPDVLAARIERASNPTTDADGRTVPAASPYRYCNTEVAFRRVATSVTGNGAQLISWPPQEETIPATKTHPAQTWKYSVVITIALRTEPFSPIPRIHIGVGIRRWITVDKVFMPTGRDVSVYLLSNSALLDGAPTPERFALASLHYDTRSRTTTWAHGGPAGMLSKLSATANFPNPELLIKEPGRWIEGRDGVTAAVVHHTMMGWHGIKAGIMPSERRRLVEWVGALLTPEFIPLGALERGSIKNQNPLGALEDKQPIAKPKRLQKPEKDATAEELQALEAENEQLKLLNAQIALNNIEIAKRNTETLARNAARRRSRVAAAVGAGGLTAELFYQTDKMRDHLIAAAESSLALGSFRTEAGPETWSWQAPDLTVRIHARPLGALGAALGGEQAPRRGAEHDEAIRARRRTVSTFCTQLAAETGQSAHIAFIEIDHPDAFGRKRTADPKFAIRLGCADAGLVSQFLLIRNPDLKPGEDDSQIRANSAWEDGLRQIGMRFIPQHSLGAAIPAQLNQLAFWLVKRRADGPTGQRQFTPIAVLIRPGQDCVMGRSPASHDWVPYPELLRALTGEVRGDELATDAQQAALAASFIKQTLRKFRGEPTLVVTHAQNTRSRWPWLKNPEIVPDRLHFGGPLQRLALHGNGLRIARIATRDRLESPEWWAPRQEKNEAGISKGLWTPAPTDPSNRVFYSTTDKLSTQTKVRTDATKATPHLNAKGNPETNATQNASNPALLQITMAGLQPRDDPETWAMFLHQQRFSDDYRDGLALPLIVHLAALTSHYALPHEDDEDDAATEIGEAETSDEQPALDT
jgi:hypothetical protein